MKLLSWCTSIWLAHILSAQQPATQFNYKSFTIPGAVTLGVASINNSGTASGYFTGASGNYSGFLRSSTTVVTPVLDGSFTVVNQVNAQGIAVGEFFNAAAGNYSGFFYNSGTQSFTTYDVPGQPTGTNTALGGITAAITQFCGFVSSPPYTTVKAFLSNNGQVTIYPVNGSSTTECLGMNKQGVSVGFYIDAAGVSHGYMRSVTGVITTIDFPGASKVPAALPCGGTAAGTVAVGISDRFDLAGHYWDAANNEHGFSRTPGGIFQQLDFPGAFQTSGGGINVQGTVAGHYLDSACAFYGYLAFRPAGGH